MTNQALIDKVLEPREHHPFGASSLSRRIACPGSLSLEIDLPDSSSEAADEGTFAHLILGTCLEDGLDAADLLGEKSKCGRFIWDEEDAEFGQRYLATVRELTIDGAEVMVEQRLDLSMLAPGCFGTADVIILDHDNGEIINVDLKWGRGVPVTAENNPQLQAGLVGAAEAFGLVGAFQSYRGMIVQPRNGGVSEQVWTSADLTDFEETVSKAWTDAVSDDPTFNPGESQCRFCRASGVCDAEAGELITLFEDDPYSVEDLPRLLPHLERMENWISNVRMHALGLALEGKPPAGWKLVLGRPGNRVWDDPAEVEKLLKTTFRLADKVAYTKKIINPTQAEKVLSPKRWKVAQERVIRKAPSPILVPESDKRSPYVPASTADDFEEEKQ